MLDAAVKVRPVHQGCGATGMEVVPRIHYYIIRKGGPVSESPNTYINILILVCLELDGLYWLHHLEEGSSSIGQVVHNAVLAIFAEGWFQHGHLVDKGFTYLWAVVFYELALDAKGLAFEGTDFSFRVGCYLTGGVGLSEGHDVNLALKE